MEEQKKVHIQEKIHGKEEKLALVHRRRKEFVIQKKDGDFIKRQDRRENVERINRI